MKNTISKEKLNSLKELSGFFKELKSKELIENMKLGGEDINENIIPWTYNIDNLSILLEIFTCKGHQNNENYINFYPDQKQYPELSGRIRLSISKFLDISKESNVIAQCYPKGHNNFHMHQIIIYPKDENNRKRLGKSSNCHLRELTMKGGRLIASKVNKTDKKNEIDLDLVMLYLHGE